MKSFLALAFLLLASEPSFAFGPQLAGKNHECGSTFLDGGQRFQYCIDRPEGRASTEVLYYFHGVLHTEQTWLEKFSDLRQEWAGMGVAQPTVISVSFAGSIGNFWLLSEPSGRYRYFRDKMMPFLEGKVGFTISRRLLMGTSMGGFNASQLMFREGRLFDRVALLSPAFIAVGPYSPQAELDEYFSRHNSGFVAKFKINTYLSFLKSEYSSPEVWSANNPLEMIQSRGLPRGLRLYISDGDSDNYGFQEGAQKFAQLATSKGAKVTWTLLEGGHGEMDEGAVAHFLLDQ